MKLIKLFTLGIPLIFLSLPSLAQDQPLTPTEKSQMLSTIKNIKGNVQKGRYGVHAAAISAFRAASASPISAYEFYLKCYKEINFTRKGAKESEYRDWKSKNKDNLSSREHSTARRLRISNLQVHERLYRPSGECLDDCTRPKRFEHSAARHQFQLCRFVYRLSTYRTARNTFDLSFL